MFTVDHSKGEAFEPIKPGEYEATVINFEGKTAASGNQRLVVDYEIRSDVEQACQGQKILYDNFTVTDNAMWRFHQASKAAGFPNGMKFKDHIEWANAFLNKPIRLVVGEREHNGNKYPEVKAFKPSEAPAPDTGSITVSDEDVPF
ncbi:DUF669 domain-containing protein [Bacillus subtilis]|uniref:DUF669 domain-containing protein n=1 Tax=Bacillus subtilis TaxID=1423 RepID=UPI0027A07EFE|nr:DUF669 domain-containing protein [Bacillus subtilis]MEC2401666.1 DUF669 domain-containing protein [Bacillus subtilis]MED4660172.1 DUF669 domain-containing protein [Bacillus subtilis]MED4664477.1 DUF669 domain-containing protein [Bacillus subtilis]WEZ27444.1 DUF669 domain-containing protein [Bacillus subtilis]